MTWFCLFVMLACAFRALFGFLERPPRTFREFARHRAPLAFDGVQVTDPTGGPCVVYNTPAAKQVIAQRLGRG